MNYQSRQADENGYIHYPREEHLIWKTLYERQIKLVQGRACQEYIDGLKHLELNEKQIPQHKDVNTKLKPFNGWQVEKVPAIIGASDFYQLLSQQKFPAASFIRTRKDLDYIQEPDIFHEIFGHCPLLTHKPYADFMHWFGEMATSKSQGKERWILFRLFWFTIEFGLVQTEQGLRAYGGGILSSPNETVYCVESELPERVPFDLLTVLRTPFRIDILQPLYYVIDGMEQLYSIMNEDIFAFVRKAQELGDLPAKFSPREDGKAGYVS